ncbi:MAG: hypothetical protein CK424_05430 [Legionella sp.]|nr:MAG: hypothetical protein CK424_05430 [Legionella sp.]
MTILKKTMMGALLASQFLLHANIGHAVSPSFTGSTSIHHIQKALSFIRTNKISLTGVCSGDLGRAGGGCAITPLSILYWEELIRAIPLTSAIGLDGPGSVAPGSESPYVSLNERSLLLFSRLANANADVGGPTIGYNGPAGTYIAVIMFTERGFIYEPRVDVGGNFLSVGYLSVPTGSTTAYSPVSVFSPIATAAARGKYYFLVAGYRIDGAGLVQPVKIEPRFITIVGTGWDNP